MKNNEGHEGEFIGLKILEGIRLKPPKKRGIEVEKKAFVVGVLGDFRGSSTTPPTKGKQKFKEINRDNFDNVMGVPFPYEFWMTRSMLTWSLRMADRPAILSNFARMVTASQQQSEDMPRIPSRLRGKIGIPAPWLPDWAGDTVYVDVLGKLFPFREFLRPIERVMMDKNRYEYDAQDILY